MSASTDVHDVGSELDPRVERSRRVILDATLAELAEEGYGSLTIEGVARRANVGKATVYRHWDGKLALVTDAIALLKQLPQPPDTDDHWDRIAGLVRVLADHVANSRYAACIPAMIEASLIDDDIRDYHIRSSAERLAYGARLLDDARVAGHLPGDTDTERLTELLVAPIFFRKLMAAEPFPVGEVDAHVATVLGPIWRP